MKKLSKAMFFLFLFFCMCITAAYASESITVTNVSYDVTDTVATYTASLLGDEDVSEPAAVVIVYYENDVLKAIDIQKTAAEPGVVTDVSASIDVERTDDSRITGFVLSSMNSGIPLAITEIEKFGSKDTGIEYVTVAGLSEDRIDIDRENKTISLYFPYYDREGNSVDFSSALTTVVLSDENASVELIDKTSVFEGESFEKTALVNYNTKKQIKIIAEEGNYDIYDVKTYKMLKEDFEDEVQILEPAEINGEITSGTNVYRGIGDKASTYLRVEANSVSAGYGNGLSAGYGEGRNSDNGFWIQKTTHNNKDENTGALRFYIGTVEGKSDSQTFEFDIKYEYVGDESVTNQYKNLFVAGAEVGHSGGGLIYRLGGNNAVYRDGVSPRFYLGSSVGKFVINTSPDILDWHRVKIEFFRDESGALKNKLYVDGQHISNADNVMESTTSTPEVYSITLSTRRCAKLYVDNICFTQNLIVPEEAAAPAVELSSEGTAIETDLSFIPSISPEGEIFVSGKGNADMVSALVTKVESQESEVIPSSLNEEDFVAFDAAYTKADGSFKFRWKLPYFYENGYYAFVVGNTDVKTNPDVRCAILYYASADEIAGALLRINSADKEEMAAALQYGKDILQLYSYLNDDVYVNYTDDVIEILVQSKVSDFETGAEVIDALSQAIGIQTLACASDDTLEDIVAKYGEDLGLDITAFSENSEAIVRCFKTVSEEFKENNKLTDKNISELFNTAIVLAKINIATRDKIIGLIEDNEALIGIDTEDFSLSEKTSLAKKLVVTKISDEYKSINELESAFENAVDSLDDGKKSGGGGSSSKPSYTPYPNSETILGSGEASNEIQISDDAADKAPVFTDLYLAPWAEDYIICLAENGIVNGKSEGIFEPESPVTREEFAKMLVLATGVSGASQTAFSDVDASAWYTPYISAAIDAGIVTGYTDGTFGTGKNITREEAAVMIARATALMHESLPEADLTFSDVNEISDYARASVENGVALGIISGNNKNQFLPKADITRAESAKMIYCLIRTE